MKLKHYCPDCGYTLIKELGKGEFWCPVCDAMHDVSKKIHKEEAEYGPFFSYNQLDLIYTK